MADHHSDGSQGAAAHNHEPRTRPQRGWSHSSSPDVYADGAGEDRFGERRLLDDDALEDEVERAVEAYEAGQEFSGYERARADSEDASGSSFYDTADEGASLSRAGSRAKRGRPRHAQDGARRRRGHREETNVPEGSSAATTTGGVRARDAEEQEQPRFDLLDHFTLRSSLFRHGNQVVLNGMRHQLIFDAAYAEDSDDNDAEQTGINEGGRKRKRHRKVVLSVKRASMYGGWVFFLKFLYVYVVLFLVGATVVFCILVPVQYGLGVFLVGIRSVNDTEERLATLMTLLAMPSFVESLSIMSTFVIGYFSDIWNDFEFINTMTLVGPVVRDWFILTAILFVPLGTFAVSFLLRSVSPITNALLAALWCSLVLFGLTMLYTVWIEIYSCLKIMQNCVDEARTLRHAFFYLLRHRLRQRFAFTYYPGMDPAFAGEALDEAKVLAHLKKKDRLGSFAQWFYYPVQPRRLWNIDTVLKPRPVLSRQDFSVLFLCCLSRSRFRGTISKSAVKSSFACVMLSSFLVWLVVVGYLVYSSFIPTILVILAGLVSFAIFITWIGHNLAWMQEFKRGSLGPGNPSAGQYFSLPLWTMYGARARSATRATAQVEAENSSASNTGDSRLVASQSSAALSTNPFEDVEVVSDRNEGQSAESADPDHVALEEIEDNPSEEADSSLTSMSNHSPQRIDIDDWQRMKAMRESRFVYAEPKIWVAILLVIFTFAIFVGIPMYGFSQLGVGGYAAFFAVACCLSIQRFVFNVPSLVENFGPKAVNSLELPLFDFIEENEDQVDAAIKAMEEAGSPGPGMGLRSLDRRSFSSSLSSIRLDAGDERDESSRLRTGMQGQAQAGRSGSGARRVHLVLTRMAQQQIRTFWMGSFALAVIAMIVLVGFSVDQDTTLSDYQGIPLHGNATHRTHVVPAPSRSKVGFMYPVCTLFDTLYAGKDEPGFVSATMPGDMQQGGGETGHFAAIAEAKLTTLDFVFLSDLAYSHAQTSQQQLDRWFGPNAVRYIPPDKYDQYAAPRLSSAVFKLLHIPSRAAGGDGGDREVFLVTVRGTINTYDLLSDMQIWFPAMLFQWLRFVLPFGAVWNSVIPSLIKYMNVLETAPSNQLSYQADLTNFVRALRAKNPDAFVAITGHSLGGGIAMLVGAAESVPAIGISGPNSVLSSLKFGFNQSMLDAFAVNIIPRGDPIPTVDDQALLTENILCRVGRGAYLGACHELKRTFCELQYICGSGDRPPVSICNTIYQFPAAIHVHNASDSP